MYQPPYSVLFFSKTHQSSLTLKGGSTSHLGLLPSGKKRKPPYSVLKPLRYKVGGPSEVFASSRAAVFCAGMNPLSLKDLVMGYLVHTACSLLDTCMLLARCWVLAVCLILACWVLVDAGITAGLLANL